MKNSEPNLYKKTMLAMVFTLSALFAAVSFSTTMVAVDYVKPLPTPLPKKVFSLLTDNQSTRLHDSAQNRADCIAREECTWSHDGWTAFVREEIPSGKAGEVLARGYENWDQVIAAWNESPTHDEIINAEWCEFSIASSSAKLDTVYVGHFACER